MFGLESQHLAFCSRKPFDLRIKHHSKLMMSSGVHPRYIQIDFPLSPRWTENVRDKWTLR